ncbi:MAG: FAD-binding oxidoreductase [Planctomycetota bacterium]|nr:FAD-binding oxidoreductase [Planctomycetota bacterium]
MPRTFDTTILAITQETPMDRTFALALPRGEAETFDFTPGQFVVIEDPDEATPRRRAYSISSPPGHAEHLELTVRAMGTFGQRFYDFPVGKTLRMRPPAGKFVLRLEPDEHLVLVGGGSGITPFRSFVGYARARQAPQPITLLHSARRPEELVFREQFESWVGPNFCYIPTVTRPEPGDGWSGRTGRVDKTLLREHVGDAAQARFYACGPAAFVAASLALAEAARVPADRRHKEQWG